MDECESCEENVDPADRLICHYCSHKFHFRCTGLSKTAFKTINDNENIIWICDACKKIPYSPIINMIEEQRNLIRNHESILQKLLKMNNLHDDALSVSVSNNNKKTFYSTALQSTSAVIVKPKDVTQKNFQTKADILQEANPVSANINITSVKNIKDGGIVVGCHDKRDADKIKKIVTEKLNGKYETREVKGISPRIKVVGISDKLDEKCVLEYIRHQNGKLVDENSQIEVLKIWPTKKNANVFQAIVQLDVNTYNRIMSVGESKLFIGYDLCNVYDNVSLIRCFKCNSYNHISKNCNNSISCPRCAGSHGIKDCTVDVLKCINCSSANSRDGSNNDVNHAVWDLNKCSVYKQKVDDFKSSVYTTP